MDTQALAAARPGSDRRGAQAKAVDPGAR